jgi:D-alanyl-lipoteichoic acid acyltransferase DltB (MBOAT superfamily)
MLFNSLQFAGFLPTVFVLYWFCLGGARERENQNLLLLVASYIFYGWWDWRFLGLIVLSSAVDFVAGLAIGGSERPQRRKAWLGLSLAVNLGVLGAFKYCEFFVESLVAALRLAGVETDLRSLAIVLPVGISFYTFQTLSYTIDVYRRRIRPTRDGVEFFAFVAFFPQLVAGPIERATNLLPQFEQQRHLQTEDAKDALRRILWGLFKKVVVADNCATRVDVIFDGYASLGASTLALGLVYFAFQIYGDFSGYSDIAIGTARLFGFKVTRNFALPYFSRDIAEFWRRWHISLTTWFRDYLYIPMGGSRGTKGETIRNTILVFVVSGLWHGANWTFVVWGLLHALYFLPLLLGRKNRRYLDPIAEGRCLPTAGDFLRIATTFGLTSFAWVFFRAPDLDVALAYATSLVSPSLLDTPSNLAMLPVIALLAAWEWRTRGSEHGLSISAWPLAARWAVYVGGAYLVLLYGARERPFVYFQF